MDKVYVIGVGEDGSNGLCRAALELVSSAELVAGGDRHLNMFPNCGQDRYVIKGPLDGLYEVLSKARGSAVVLASGDPMFYGIGSKLIERFGPERVQVWPAVSSMQLAFARAGMSWEDAKLYSVHARPLRGLARLVATHRKVGLFTDAVNSPSAIGSYLSSWGLGDAQMFVGERLGGPNETCWWGSAEEAATRVFDPLNVVILVNARAAQRVVPGIHEDEFHQRKPLKGLITKWEVRVIALSRMFAEPASVVWDIGTGSGSVAVEAAMMDPSVTVYAIEKNAEDYEIASANVRKFVTDNVELRHGLAPGDCLDFPEPDAVFVGGSGGRLSEILGFISRRLKPRGRVVIDVATVENLGEAIGTLKTLGFVPQVDMVSVARGREVVGLTRLEALNPVYVIWAQRGG